LISALLETQLGHFWVQLLVLATSLVVIVLAARCRPSLSLAIIATTLVSYHLNAQDASPLIIPIGLALCSNSVRGSVVAMATLICPFTALYPLYAFISAIPILILFKYRASGDALIPEYA